VVAAGIVAGAVVTLAGCGGGEGPPPVVDAEAVVASPLVAMQDSAPALTGPEGPDRIREMAALGADVIRIDLQWDQVAPTRPSAPRDPGDPAYLWDGYDRAVAAAGREGVEVLFAVFGTPGWAADPAVTPPAGTPANAVRPADPADFGDFAAAAATRYAPRGVSRWEGWNEPNIPFFLYPQYERSDGRWVAVSPATYAALQKRFYAAVKGVDPDAVVGGAVTAPAGDRRQEPPPQRVTPDDFLRALDAPELRPPMDVVSHHPYPATAPRERTPPGRNYIDLYNLDVLERTLDRTYLRGRPVWLTEYGFGTEPLPGLYELAFTYQEQAAFIADALVRVRAHRRVRLASYYLLRDHPGWRSGVRDQEGREKPGRQAFALPLTADGATVVAAGAPVRLVGQVRPADRRTDVDIEWNGGDGWRELAVVSTADDGTFALSIRPSADGRIRARWAGADGVEWTSPEVAVGIDGG
jgi:hypothetical protein